MARSLKMRFHLPDPASDLRWTLKRLRPEDKLYVGIDPGMTGAIAFVPTRRKLDPVIVDIPTKTSRVKTTRKGKAVMGNRNEYDHAKIVAILDPLIDYREKVVICLERGQPYQEDTPKTAFQVGVGFGMWGLYFAAFGLRVEEIKPAVWKRRMGLSGGSENKDYSRSLTMRLYPGACHFVEFVGDHNRAEAVLLAEYQRRLDANDHKWPKPKPRPRKVGPPPKGGKGLGNLKRTRKVKLKTDPTIARMMKGLKPKRSRRKRGPVPLT